MRPRSERFAIYLLLAAAYMTACHMHEHRPLRMRGPWGVPTSESRSQTAAAVEIHGHAFRAGGRREPVDVCPRVAAAEIRECACPRDVSEAELEPALRAAGSSAPAGAPARCLDAGL